MKVGLARHLQLLRIVGTSVTLHQLSCYRPSLDMQLAWNAVESRLGAGPRGWANLVLPFARELIAAPSNLDDLNVISTQAKLSSLLRTQLWLPSLEERVAHASRVADAPFEHAQRMWFVRGILTSWRGVLDLAVREGWVEQDAELRTLAMKH
eukprot:550342-Amphidinium_carterae.1